jgi:AraC family transcriptional regulator
MQEQTYRAIGQERGQQRSLQSLAGTSVDEESKLAREIASHRHPLLTAQLASIVVRLLDRAVETLGRDHAVAKDCVVAKDCIAQAYALLGTEPDQDGSARGGLAPWQVREVTKYIDAELASTLRVNDCAAITGLSTSYFSRAFKISFGTTFRQYVARRRTERAQEMMLMTNEGLCQIALRCGFGDQSHFTRVYHAQVGSSPGSWRRQRQRKQPNRNSIGRPTSCFTPVHRQPAT